VPDNIALLQEKSSGAESNFFRRTIASIFLKFYLIVVVGAVEMWKTQKNTHLISLWQTHPLWKKLWKNRGTFPQGKYTYKSFPQQSDFFPQKKTTFPQKKMTFPQVFHRQSRI